MANNPGTAVRPRARSARLWLLVRYRLTPWWLRVVVLWTLSRVVTTWMMLVFAAWQGPNQWTGAHPDYLQFAQFWDSGWYHTIATTGYPAVLPFIDGHVAANAWAFMPGYPFLVRALMEVTALPWEPVSVFVSIKLERQRSDELDRFGEAIAEWPEVMECYLMTGQFDYLLRVVCADLAAYEIFLREKLTRVEGVGSIESSFSLAQVKYSRALPI